MSRISEQQGSLKKANALYDSAKELLKKGQKQEAADALGQASHLNPSDDRVYALLGQILSDEGQAWDAMECLATAISLKPDILEYKARFVSIAQHMLLKTPNPDLKNLLAHILQDDRVDFSDLGALWFSLMMLEPWFEKLYDFVVSDMDLRLVRCLDIEDDEKIFSDPFFLLGLRRVTVFNTKFEYFLMQLRCYSLENYKASLKPFVSALADYCFRTEFIFNVSDKEKEILSRGVPDDLRACYESDARFKIDFIPPKITSIDDDVSRQVQGQYEEFPYPRWQSFSVAVKDEEAEGYLRDFPAQILIAGCGTGKEAIEMGAAFPNAAITAVDLSSASLSYAMMKAKQYGIQNITFGHGDILNLDVLGKKFDHICSSGVLHHMKDPVRGWKGLVRLLNDNGTMRIALYSRTARQAVNEARTAIVEKGYSNDADSMRRFRADIQSLLSEKDYKDITRFRDYYFMSECRDLLFHVQEHQYDLQQIKAILSSLGLEFTKFFLDYSVIKDFQNSYPMPSGLKDLDLWQKYETKQPETFRAMYRFWCKKH